jgi:hypothetical protein
MGGFSSWDKKDHAKRLNPPFLGGFFFFSEKA